MTTSVPALTRFTKYAIRRSIDGMGLGLDGSERNPASGGAALGDAVPYLMGRDFQGLRLFSLANTGIEGCDYKITAPLTHTTQFDDFLGAAISNQWNANKGSDGSTGNAIRAANNGTVRLTTGAGSTHTMAVNGAQITSALTMLISDSANLFESRLGTISALTSQSICFGLVDVSTLSAPFTLTTATVTANGTNGAAFLQDAAGTNTHLNAVSVNAGGTPQVVALTQDVDTAAFHIYRIEIDGSGNASYFIDGSCVAKISAAVASTAILTPSVGMFSEATSGSQTLDIDYIYTQSLRV